MRAQRASKGGAAILRAANTGLDPSRHVFDVRLRMRGSSGIFAECGGLRPLLAGAPGLQVDRAVRDADVEGCADGPVTEAALAAMRAHQFGRDRKPKPSTAGAGR